MDVFVNHYNRLFQTFVYQSLSSCLKSSIKKKRKKSDLQMRFTEQANLWREIYGDINFIYAI